MSLGEIQQIVRIVDSIDKSKEERLKPKKKVNHINTKTTRTTDEMTRRMSSELEGMVREITKRVQQDRSITLEELKKPFKDEVGSIIANGIRESYLLGLHFMESFAERTVTLTPEMVSEMNEHIKKSIDQFWNGIYSRIQKDNEKKVVGAAVFDGELFKYLSAFLKGSAISMNYFALNQSSLSTYKQIFHEDVLDGAIEVTGSIEIPQLIWVTRKDDKVDQQCLDLEGKTWNIDEPNIPRPVQDTHFGCRCRLLPKQGSKVFNA